MFRFSITAFGRQSQQHLAAFDIPVISAFKQMRRDFTLRGGIAFGHSFIIIP